ASSNCKYRSAEVGDHLTIRVKVRVRAAVGVVARQGENLIVAGPRGHNLAVRLEGHARRLGRASKIGDGYASDADVVVRCARRLAGIIPAAVGVVAEQREVTLDDCREPRTNAFPVLGLAACAGRGRRTEKGVAGLARLAEGIVQAAVGVVACQGEG